MKHNSEQLAGLVTKEFTAFGHTELLVCDGNCRKAWGVNSRPKIEFSDTNPDDYAFLPDDEVGDAPDDPGTYEGGHAKPSMAGGPHRQNKWCYRECERSVSFIQGQEIRRPHDFSQRLYNIRSRRLLEEGQ